MERDFEGGTKDGREGRGSREGTIEWRRTYIDKSFSS